jgi:hypothetical protein
MRSDELAEFRGEVPHLHLPHPRPGTSGTEIHTSPSTALPPRRHDEADVGDAAGHDAKCWTADESLHLLGGLPTSALFDSSKQGAVSAADMSLEGNHGGGLGPEMPGCDHRLHAARTAHSGFGVSGVGAPFRLVGAPAMRPGNLASGLGRGLSPCSWWAAGRLRLEAANRSRPRPHEGQPPGCAASRDTAYSHPAEPPRRTGLRAGR